MEMGQRVWGKDGPPPSLRQREGSFPKGLSGNPGPNRLPFGVLGGDLPPTQLPGAWNGLRKQVSSGRGEALENRLFPASFICFHTTVHLPGKGVQ